MMLDYVPSFCQLKKCLNLIWAPLMLQSCAYFEEVVELEDTKLHVSKKWLDDKRPFKFLNQEQEVPFHPFYDNVPKIRYSQRTITYYPINNAESQFHYDFDLLSGQTYYSHLYCPQKDAWENVSSVELPPFTQGIVPRVFDQLGDPQKIYVFGELSSEEKSVKTARVVGGIVEQFCKNPPCTGGQGWTSRMVLMAVNPSDSGFFDIEDLKDLKNAVEWDEVKAFIENMRGSFPFGGKIYPSKRVLGNIEPSFALRFATGSGKLFKKKDLLEVKRSCRKLYKYMWNYMGKKSMEKSIRKKMSRLNFDDLQKAKSYELAVKNALMNIDETFRDRFVTTFRKYREQFQVCTQMVRYHSINEDYRRYWFFTFLDLFYRLNRIGHYYQCSSQSWQSAKNINNIVRDYNKLVADRLGRCSTSAIQKSFEKGVLYLKELRQRRLMGIRHITYDSGVLNTKKKIYSWVKEYPWTLSCEVQERHNKPVFPEDVHWEKYGEKI